MMRRMLAASMMVMMSVMLLAGCGPRTPTFTYRDGVFTAVSEADAKGYAWVKVFIAADDIMHLDIIEFDGTGLAKDYDVYGGDRFTILKEAHRTLADRIVEADTWEVDAFTGATGTSVKVKDAVRRALDRALADRPGTGTYYDGTFMAISDRTSKGWGIAWVTLKDDRIVEVKLAGTTPQRDAEGKVMTDAKLNALWALKDDSYPHQPYHEAKQAIAQAIVTAQRPEVDAYTGATGSSGQWVQAVRRALDAATR